MMTRFGRRWAGTRGARGGNDRRAKDGPAANHRAAHYDDRGAPARSQRV